MDASGQFLGDLKGVTDPEAKRKIIGREFIEVFEREAAELKNAQFLAQGTLYPDVIETGGARTDGHQHQEPSQRRRPARRAWARSWSNRLRDLFKDEVRELGVELGLPDDMVWRHPFPGPGLAVRFLGEVSPSAAKSLREADAIVIDELRAE